MVWIWLGLIRPVRQAVWSLRSRKIWKLERRKSIRNSKKNLLLSAFFCVIIFLNIFSASDVLTRHNSIHHRQHTYAPPIYVCFSMVCWRVCSSTISFNFSPLNKCLSHVEFCSILCCFYSAVQCSAYCLYTCVCLRSYTLFKPLKIARIIINENEKWNVKWRKENCMYSYVSYRFIQVNIIYSE